MNHLEYIQNLIGKGIWSFTSEEIGKAMNKNPRDLIFQLREKGRIISPGRGFYVIVPEEYIHSDRLPVDRYIDSLMNYSGRSYYAGLLTAALYYGAAHQSPQVFQVITDRDRRNIVINKNRIVFFRKSIIDDVFFTRRKTATGYFNISTPEITLLDLVEYNRTIGGLDRAAAIAMEIESLIRVRHLGRVLDCYPVPVIQRCGYILDQLGLDRLCHPIEQYLTRMHVTYTCLKPSGLVSKTNRNPRWKLFINESIVPDL